MPDEDARRLLGRLESVAKAVASREARVGLAFSGGLKSLVLGSLLRKQTHITGVVVGLRGCADLAAAELAKQYLDFDLRFVILTPRSVLAAAREIVAMSPTLPLSAALDRVSIHRALAEFARGPVVIGVLADSLHGALPAAPSACRVILPLAGPPIPTGLTRTRLISAGRLIGLPEAFLRQRARPPAVGSGIEPALRRLALEKEAPLQALLRDRRRSRE